MFIALDVGSSAKEESRPLEAGENGETVDLGPLRKLIVFFCVWLQVHFAMTYIRKDIINGENGADSELPSDAR